MDTAEYRNAFRREAAALATAARKGLDAAVPSCPGWTVATLVSHLTFEVYATRIKHVALRPRGDVVQSYDDLDLPPQFKEWCDGEYKEPAVLPDGLVELFERVANGLEEALYALPPNEPMYTWWEADRTAGFMQRRMALETAIHRWDTQLAHGQPAAVEAALAAEGIEETFEVMVPARRGWAEHPRQGAGETYHFHRTDGPGEWLVRFAPEGPVISREHARGDVALRGSASDLFLFLWQRIPAERLEVFGDVALVHRYFELVPPD
jgi:uncharacterized protein (TIGR03083 family)